MLRPARRTLLGLAGAALAAPAIGQARPRVVVIGGGPAGMAAARVLGAAGSTDVVLIERQTTYRPPWRFNAALGGLGKVGGLGYGGLAQHGITMLHATALAIDTTSGNVRLADGAIPWDRLVVAPGIGFRPSAIPGLDDAPSHGWTSEAGVDGLQRGLASVPQGGLVVMLAPPAPLRCPPGPYERASMIAHRLRSTGRGDARVMLLDAKETGALLGLFQDGWERNQPGMVDWLPPSIHGGVERADLAKGLLATGLGDLQADLVCVIPAQRAADLALPLADGSGWCPVDPATMRSPAHPHIFVAGDAAALSPIVKSAVAAEAGGRAAAAAVLASLGLPAPDRPALLNRCWARLAPGDAIRSDEAYAIEAGTIRLTGSSASAMNESRAVRAAAFTAAADWADMFGSTLYGSRDQ